MKKTKKTKKTKKIKGSKKHIPLRQATVQDARKHYLQGTPLQYFYFQTFGGKMEDDEEPYTESRTGFNTFTFDGNLELVNENGSKITPNWLFSAQNGPYFPDDTPEQKETIYYLGGMDSEGWDRIQICSDPLNTLSTDCLDEVGVWVIDE